MVAKADKYSRWLIYSGLAISLMPGIMSALGNLLTGCGISIYIHYFMAGAGTALLCTGLIILSGRFRHNKAVRAILILYASVSAAAFVLTLVKNVRIFGTSGNDLSSASLYPDCVMQWLYKCIAACYIVLPVLSILLAVFMRKGSAFTGAVIIAVTDVIQLINTRWLWQARLADTFSDSHEMSHFIVNFSGLLYSLVILAGYIIGWGLFINGTDTNNNLPELAKS